MYRHLILLTAACLYGCASAPQRVTVPEVVKVPVVEYVAVPAALTVACPVAMPADRTIGTLVGIAYARRQALEQCNRQLDAIRKLGAPSK